MTERYERQMKKGVLEILVLKLLDEEEKYGYQLISELRSRSGEFFSLKEGTLYPILYRLEDDGLVTGKWSIPSGKEVSKKYYQITDKGGIILKETMNLWKEFSRKVDTILEVEQDESESVFESGQ